MTIRNRGLITLAFLASVACTKDELFVPPASTDIVLDNRVELMGSFCAENADDLRSFLKIVIVMDRSNSMTVTDTNNRRIAAATELVRNYLANESTQELRAGVEFAIVSFYGDVDVHTRDERGLPGFTSDGRQAIFALPQLARVGSNTNFQGALSRVFTLLDRDMAQLDEVARERTRYEIIFLSDGQPFPNNCRGEPNSATNAVRAVRRVVSLGSLYGIDVHLSTVFAAKADMFNPGAINIDGCTEHDPYVANYATIGETTRAIMQDMAAQGGGTFRQFLNGDAITFAGFEFAESRRIYALSNFMTSNLSARPVGDTLMADSDRDGLTDLEEYNIGSSQVRADSDGDGFNDMVEWRFRLSGFDPMDPTDAACTPLTRVDSDVDGLLDCEEIFLGTQRRSFDSDNDSSPDFIEVTFQGNPRSANSTQDRYADDDADGGGNADELRWHTDPKVNDVAYRAKFAYQYDQRQLPLTAGSACYEFDVKNVRMASTQPLPLGGASTRQEPAGVNRIMLYFAQTPYDEPEGDPVYRLACVEGRYVQERDLKMPASGRFRLPERRPSDTYEASGVLRPNNDICQASVNQDCGLGTLWCRFEITGACTCCKAREAGTDPNDGTDCQACPACSDGQDNDGDGLTDFPYDPDCFDSVDTDEGNSVACSDGIDNDGDGYIDFPNEPGCESGYDTDETDGPVPRACSNFGIINGQTRPIDDDGDGAANYPADPDCDSAYDDDEGNPDGSLGPPACDDGQDNDGDGLTDYPLDPGCGSRDDPDEAGPQTCFFCERFTDALPGQCDIAAGFCKPRSGQVPEPRSCTSNTDCGTAAIGYAPCVGGQCVPTAVNGVGPETNCTSRADCRGAPCVAANGSQCLGTGPCVGGLCSPCLQNADCDTAPGAADGLCDPSIGWCLQDGFTPTECVGDGDCATGVCETDIGVCSVDPYYACDNDKDCREDEICALERGFCLRRSFITEQCDTTTACTQDIDGDGQPDGSCNADIGWCLPSQERFQCRQDDECPFGNCVKDSGAVFGYCDQQTFVFPRDFKPEVDCIRGR